jgi:UDPglucose 6-dehydrogenase
MKLSIIGAGYVGLSLYALLLEQHDVMLCDINEDKVKMLSQKKSPIDDPLIEQKLKHYQSEMKLTTKDEEAILHGEIIFIAVPTNYDVERNYFDTKFVDDVLKLGMEINPKALYVIKSTIPVNYTETKRAMYQSDHIMFSPEFLREDHALYDNLYPSRIIVGHLGEHGDRVGHLLKSSALKQDVEILKTTSTEAEAIKLFSNTYLAMRISFFNELDTFSELHQMNSKRVIHGVGLDPRIGLGYNNPSFGYGGYCLPKDTKQLLANYEWIPQNLIQAIVSSNETRKDHIVNMIIAKQPKVVGIYRLTMKKDSDNIRESSIQGVITRLRSRMIEVVIYEPLINESKYLGCTINNDLMQFKANSDLIVCNRLEDELLDVSHKLYTRDIFSSDQ